MLLYQSICTATYRIMDRVHQKYVPRFIKCVEKRLDETEKSENKRSLLNNRFVLNNRYIGLLKGVAEDYVYISRAARQEARGVGGPTREALKMTKNLEAAANTSTPPKRFQYRSKRGKGEEGEILAQGS